MSIEGDAQSLLNQLAYSLDAKDEELANALKAIIVMLGHLADAAESLPAGPGLLVANARLAYGPWAADGLSALAGWELPRRGLRFEYARLHSLHDRLGDVAKEHGQSVTEWAATMDFFFRDLLGLGFERADASTYVGRVLHVALGFGAAHHWHRICNAARPQPQEPWGEGLSD
ncbi:hypothetical protein [Ideonella paludis]|uniref:Uncharacterized protein n=1 Tax=Ideonella paludis TaxID=1233411 RepID=A0ABS5E3H1_9BURK|nr:hypothetical protein [Ideonella paludis]MBQ0937566.1 hypothetical protein [Ideonella paludis]